MNASAYEGTQVLAQSTPIRADLNQTQTRRDRTRNNVARSRATPSIPAVAHALASHHPAQRRKHDIARPQHCSASGKERDPKSGQIPETSEAGSQPRWKELEI
jgi:hypothetical protein